MTSADIVYLYKQGFSIDFIVDRYYMSNRKINKVINTCSKRILVIENSVNKNEARKIVYRIIYSEIKDKKINSEQM